MVETTPGTVLRLTMIATRHHILVEPLPLPSVQSGIHLVQRHHPSAVATVVSAGPAVRRDWPELRDGAVVAIRPMGGTDFEHAGRRYKRMTKDDVLALIMPDANLQAV